VVVGGGTNLVVSDSGFRGLALRFRGEALTLEGARATAQAGAPLERLVDLTIARGLAGLETLAGIPGSVGAAVYGNAGAYGRSIGECVAWVRCYDGARVRVLQPRECEFAYRESVFKRRKDWVIFSAGLDLVSGDAKALRRRADEILAERNLKFPPAMKCAGSVFKNLLVKNLPAAAVSGLPEGLVREGKVPAAWFLEQVGAKGASRGDIHVAERHANLIYNGGAGTAADLCALIAELKAKVRARFGIRLEEEVQFVG
jgi:UDP-N-acetylmuramate dehydrogenase